MGRWALLLGLAAGLAALVLGLQLGGDTVEQWQLAARYTARIGFFLLMIVFTASSLAALWPSDWTRRLLRDRRWWGLGFAACHTVHLAALLTRSRLAGEPIEPTSLIGGGLAYVLLFAMVLTSTAAAQRALGRNWKRLHKLGIYYLWLIFLQTYLGRIGDPASRAVGIVLSVVALAAWGLRIAAWLKVRTRRRSGLTPTSPISSS